MAVLIPLKLKYNNPNRRLLKRDKIDPPEGTWVFNGGRFTTKARSNAPKAKASSIRPRRHAYGPW